MTISLNARALIAYFIIICTIVFCNIDMAGRQKHLNCSVSENHAN